MCWEARARPNAFCRVPPAGGRHDDRSESKGASMANMSQTGEPAPRTAGQLPGWTFEPGHTEAGFRARHMMVTWVRGMFPDVHGKLRFDWDDPLTASFSGTIDARKIWTGQEERDAHLRSADFFDVERHPAIAFSGRLTE